MRNISGYEMAGNLTVTKNITYRIRQNHDSRWFRNKNNISKSDNRTTEKCYTNHNALAILGEENCLNRKSVQWFSEAVSNKSQLSGKRHLYRQLRFGLRKAIYTFTHVLGRHELCNRDKELYILKKIFYTAIVGILHLNFIRFLKDLFKSVTCC